MLLAVSQYNVQEAVRKVLFIEGDLQIAPKKKNLKN